MSTNGRYRLILVAAAALMAAAALYGTGRRGPPREFVRYTARVKDMPVLRGVVSPTRDLTEDDLKDLADWNVTLVRFQIMRNWRRQDTERDLPEFDAWFDSRLDNFEKMLPVARRLGILMALDFHTPPGGRREKNIMRMFDEEEYGDHFVAVWRRIALRFRDNPDKEAIWAYDLLNEPIESPEAARRGAGEKLMLRAALAVREIDPDMALMVAPTGGGDMAGFRKFKPLPLENVIYQVHMYAPFSYTHQFVLPETTPPVKGRDELLEYPGFIRGGYWGKARLRRVLQPVRDFQLRHRARIYAGEFSAIVWAPNADIWLRDCISIFEEYGWDWSFHSFREWEGFSLEHAGVRPFRFWPAPNNPRKKVVLEALKKKRTVPVTSP